MQAHGQSYKKKDTVKEGVLINRIKNRRGVIVIGASEQGQIKRKPLSK
jgi:hypothetical protein